MHRRSPDGSIAGHMRVVRQWQSYVQSEAERSAVRVLEAVSSLATVPAAPDGPECWSKNTNKHPRPSSKDQQGLTGWGHARQLNCESAHGTAVLVVSRPLTLLTTMHWM